MTTDSGGSSAKPDRASLVYAPTRARELASLASLHDLANDIDDLVSNHPYI